MSLIEKELVAALAENTDLRIQVEHLRRLHNEEANHNLSLRTELMTLRAEVEAYKDAATARDRNEDELRAEVEALRAECLRLSHAEADAMSVVLSQEEQIGKLRAEVEALRAERDALKKLAKMAVDGYLAGTACEYHQDPLSWWGNKLRVEAEYAAMAACEVKQP